MSEQTSHIISKFSWNTRFDKKEKGSELQERLSAWSRTHMPKEVTEVFDNVCPPEQTWKIQSLEIDLGPIDYNNLEFELSTKLRNQLNEKLIDLIIYANRGGNNLEIVNEDTSHLYLISSFLLNGLMPWSYKPTDGTVNQILAGQLQTNRSRAVDRLREVGETHENVRKRMAWQLTEPNIIKIIEGLEPNNHTQIIEFSNELTKIQAKETIVQTSTTDFKKHLWLWILNYLLTERGTVFNRVAYMRSTIRQMAGHYNIGYTDLLALIERAVEVVSKTYGIKTEFLLTIKAIIQEDGNSGKNEMDAVENSGDYWDTLQTYFGKELKTISQSEKSELNELIINLSRQNSQKFRAIILSLGYNEQSWFSIISVLNKASIEAIFYTLNKEASAGLIRSIYVLNKALNKVSVNVNQNILWGIGLKYFYNNTTADTKAFLSYCITEIAQTKNLNKTKLLNKLTSFKLEVLSKTDSLSNVFAEFNSIYVDEVASNDSEFITKHFAELFDMLIKQLSTGITNKDQFITAQQMLVKNIRLYPQIAFEILKNYPDKAKLQELIPYILDDYTTSILIKQIGNTSPVFKLLQVIIREVKADVNYKTLKIIIDEILTPLTLQTLIISPVTYSASSVFGVIFNRFNQLIATVQAEYFKLFISRLIQENKLPEFKISDANEAFIDDKNQNSPEQIELLIKSGPNKQLELAKLLNTDLSFKVSIQKLIDNNQSIRLIFNYLIPNGDKLQNLLLKEYTDILTHELSHTSAREINTRLTQLYWQCITNYAAHRGQVDRLKKSFHTAVLYHFHLPSNRILFNKNQPNSLTDHLPAGKQLMDKVIAEYDTVLSHQFHSLTKAEITTRLARVYKKCLANYNQHGGQRSELIKHFKAAVESEFSLKDHALLIPIIHLHRSDESNKLSGKRLMDTLIDNYLAVLKHELVNVSEQEIKRQLINFYRAALANNTNHSNGSEAIIKHFRALVLAKYQLRDENLLYVVVYTSPDLKVKPLQDQQFKDWVISTYSTILRREFTSLSETEIVVRLTKLYNEYIEKQLAPITDKQAAIKALQIAISTEFHIDDQLLLGEALLSSQEKAYSLKNGRKLTQREVFLFLEEAIDLESATVKAPNGKLNIKELIALALDINPTQLRDILAHTPISQKRLELLKSAVPFNQFSLWISRGTSSSIAEVLESIGVLYDIIQLTTSGSIVNQLLDYYWLQSWQLIISSAGSSAGLKRIVQYSLQKLTQQPGVNTDLIISVIKRNNIRLTPILERVLADCIPAFVKSFDVLLEDDTVNELVIFKNQELLDELSYAIIIQKQIPTWYTAAERQSITTLLNAIITNHPASVLHVLRQEIVSEHQMEWLHEAIDFSSLLGGIIYLNRPKQSLLNIIEQFYNVLSQISINGISAKKVQYILFRKIIKAWQSDNWKLLSAENIWNELAWDVCTQNGVDKRDFIRGVEKSQASLPVSLQISFDYLKAQYQASTAPAPIKTEIIKPVKAILQKKDNMKLVKGGIPVKNAGLVIANTYLPMLFERLGLTADKKFISVAAQCDAVHYAQYVVTGLSATEESLLPLNKVLCGVPLSHPIPDSISISEEQATLINGLIQAMIGYWPAIGHTSIDGLRGNWLVRDGLLVEQEDRWELTVEKRAYDLLIHKSPFSFSIIKYPWMDKPLHVNWPY